jgi:hypothetical protein
MNNDMILLKTALLKFAFLFVLSAPSVAQKPGPVVIEGKVISEATGQPVSQAHVFILDGEEEALTNNKGEFKIKTWQPAPFKLTVEKHDGFRRISIVIKDPGARQVIRLQSR